MLSNISTNQSHRRSVVYNLEQQKKQNLFITQIKIAVTNEGPGLTNNSTVKQPLL
jgi:hypothetical protein